MDLTIAGRHVDVTDAMRAHARERVHRLERYSPHLTRVTVTLAIEGERHSAEIVAGVRRHGELVAKTETHDMYQAIDQATEKIEKQLHRLERRVKDRRETGRDKWAAPPPETAEEEPESSVSES